MDKPKAAPGETRGAPADGKRFARNVKAVAALITAIGLLAGSIGGLLIYLGPPAPSTSPATPEVAIAFPVADTVVDATETIRGTSRSVPAGSVIWLVVFSPDVGRYYPQNEPAVMETDGGWSGTAYIGLAADTGKRFDILALVADRAVQDSFAAYQAESRAAGSWPGLRSLPAGDARVSRVSVIRR